jgi:hypothetical protein
MALAQADRPLREAEEPPHSAEVADVLAPAAALPPCTDPQEDRWQ